MHQGDPAAAIEPAALSEPDRGVAVELPSHAVVAGEEEIAARPQLQVASDWRGELCSHAPGLVLEIPAYARPGLQRSAEHAAAAPLGRRLMGNQERRGQQQHRPSAAHEAPNGFPSASMSLISPSFSSRIPASIFDRSPTTTQTRLSGWITAFAAAPTEATVCARTLSP